MSQVVQQQPVPLIVHPLQLIKDELASKPHTPKFSMRSASRAGNSSPAAL